MDITKLEVLKNKMLLEKDLLVIWTYFLDNFAESEEFINIGKFKEKQILEKIALHILKKLFNIETDEIESRIINIPEYNFYHGSAICDSKFVSILYFEDDDIGMLAIPSLDGNNEMVRFNVKDMTNMLN
jgi:hypothetical protein